MFLEKEIQALLRSRGWAPAVSVTPGGMLHGTYFQKIGAVTLRLSYQEFADKLSLAAEVQPGFVCNAFSLPAPRKRLRAILDELFVVIMRRSPLLDDANNAKHVIAQMIRDLPGADPHWIRYTS